jgi:hypothetical protein
LNPLPIPGGPVYALIFWVAFALWVTPELVAWKIKRSADAVTACDRGSLILISVLWWSGIVADFSFALLLPQADIAWHRTVVFIAGVCLTYYLTYHRDATRKQIESCYPQFAEFLRLKKKYDPEERFQSDWYRHYRTMFADSN